MKKHLFYYSISGLLVTLSVATVLSVTAPDILRADEIPSETEIVMDGEDSTRAGYSGFVEIGDSFRYYDPKTGEYLTGLQTIDGYTYYFYPTSGVALGGLQVIDGKEYYFNPTTKRQMTGIVEVTYKDGKKQKHFFLKEGGKASGWAQQDGKNYYFSDQASGAVMLYGRQLIYGKIFCFDEKTGEQIVGVGKADDGKYYFFDSTGGIRYGLQEFNGNLYLFPDEQGGAMDYGLDAIGKALYYFDKTTGAAVKNKSITQGHIIYTFGSDGKMTSVKAESGYENSKRAKLIIAGLNYLGEPYALEKESGFSCGYFVKTALSHINITVPKSSDQQAKAVVVNGQNGKTITEEHLRVGDTIYWILHNCTETNCTHWQEVHHVGIYIGDGKVLESVEHRGCVTVDNLREYSTYTIEYYIRYIDENGDPYQDEILDLKPPAVTNLKAVSAGRNKVSLSWTASKGAEGYLIYGQKNGSYGYVGMTTQGTTFTDTKALFDDYNFYWVFPYTKTSKGKMITGPCTKYVFAKGVCAAVTNLKASSLKGGVKLTWTASKDATGYLIYGIVDGKPYGYVGMTSGTTFTDKKASSAQYNYYWVFPYFKASTSSNMIVGLTGKYTYGRSLK